MHVVGLTSVRLGFGLNLGFFKVHQAVGARLIAPLLVSDYVVSQ